MSKLAFSSNTADQLIGFMLLVIILYFSYQAFFKKKYKYNKLKKYGLKLPAKVISIRKTNLSIGDDSSATPITEIVFELEYPKNTIRKETIRHAFSGWETIPKPGHKITILMDKANPRNSTSLKMIYEIQPVAWGYYCKTLLSQRPDMLCKDCISV